MSAQVAISTPPGGFLTLDALAESLNILLRVDGLQAPARIRVFARGDRSFTDAFRVLKLPWSAAFPFFSNDDEESKLLARRFMHEFVLPRRAQLEIANTGVGFEAPFPDYSRIAILCCIDKDIMSSAQAREGVIAVEAFHEQTGTWIGICKSPTIKICTKDNDLAMPVSIQRWSETPEGPGYCDLLFETVVALLQQARIVFNVPYVRLLNEEQHHLPQGLIWAIKQVMIYFLVPKNRQNITAGESHHILRWGAIFACLVNGLSHRWNTTTIGKKWPHGLFIPRDSSAVAGERMTEIDTYIIFHAPVQATQELETQVIVYQNESGTDEDLIDAMDIDDAEGATFAWEMEHGDQPMVNQINLEVNANEMDFPVDQREDEAEVHAFLVGEDDVSCYSFATTESNMHFDQDGNLPAVDNTSEMYTDKEGNRDLFDKMVQRGNEVTDRKVSSGDPLKNHFDDLHIDHLVTQMRTCQCSTPDLCVCNNKSVDWWELLNLDDGR